MGFLGRRISLQRAQLEKILHKRRLNFELLDPAYVYFTLPGTWHQLDDQRQRQLNGRKWGVRAVVGVMKLRELTGTGTHRRLWSDNRRPNKLIRNSYFCCE